MRRGASTSAPDGERVIATERESIISTAEGRITGHAPNGGPAYRMMGLERRLGLTVPVFIQASESKRPTVAVETSDDPILETYLKHAPQK